MKVNKVFILGIDLVNCLNFLCLFIFIILIVYWLLYEIFGRKVLVYYMYIFMFKSSNSIYFFFKMILMLFVVIFNIYKCNDVNNLFLWYD